MLPINFRVSLAIGADSPASSLFNGLDDAICHSVRFLYGLYWMSQMQSPGSLSPVTVDGMKSEWCFLYTSSPVKTKSQAQA